MKKIIIMFTTAVVLFSVACKKKVDEVSTVEIASSPTISLTGAQFYSIPVGGALPTISATAYDSIIKESYSTSLDASSLDNSVPGLYTVQIKSSNKFGYISSKNVYVAVTDISNTWDLTGEYIRTANNAPVNLTKVANGLYEVDNVGGAPTLPVVGYFIQINDSTIDFPLQPTSNVGDIDCLNETLTISGTDTSYSWIVDNNFFGTANRTFVKQ